jgi:glycosyltransferase involved in cell wall biosynthesis
MDLVNKTLVIISPAFPANESEDYWVPSQQLLVKALKRNYPGLNLVVLAYFYPYKKIVYEWHGVKVISFNGMKLNRLILSFKMWRKLKKLKKENNVIGLFSFWCREGALVGKWFGKWNKLKHFCWICGQDARGSNNYAKWIRPKPAELVAISDFLAMEFHKNHGIKPAHVIPNAIDPGLFQTDPSLKKDIDLLAAGSLVELKRPEIFVSVIAKLKRHVPSLKAVICGGGDQEENLKRQIDQYGLGTDIDLTGGIPHKETLQLMQRSKILLHPSSFEGFSTVCLEALYAGCYVISFTKPMAHDIRNWCIVKTEDEMVKKSLELLKNVQLTHEMVLVYDVNDTVKQIMQLFD